jgi:hypothetical protein
MARRRTPQYRNPRTGKFQARQLPLPLDIVRNLRRMRVPLMQHQRNVLELIRAEELRIEDL